MHFENLPDCCWTYLQGVNNKNITFKKFQLACLKKFNAVYSSNITWKVPAKVTGAVLFCGAYSGNSEASGADATTAKKIVLSSLEKICGFIEDNDLGYIIEIPNFKNGLHLSTITPRLWVIDQVKFKRSLINWMKDPKIKESYYKKYRARW